MKIKSSRFFASTLLLLAPAFSRAQDYPSMKQDVALFKLSDTAEPEVVIFREADCAKPHKPIAESIDPNLETIQINDIAGKALFVIERNQTTTEGRYRVGEAVDPSGVWHSFTKSEVIPTNGENGLLISGIHELLEKTGKQFGIISPNQRQALTSAALTTVLLGHVQVSGDPPKVVAKKTKPSEDQDDWVPMNQSAKPQPTEEDSRLPIHYFSINNLKTESVFTSTTASNKSAHDK